MPRFDRHPIAVLLAAALVQVAAPSPAAAGLADLIPNLLGTEVRLAPPSGNFPSHETHFVDESLALYGTGQTLSSALVSQLATFPLASSAGGFTYTFDPTLGTFTRGTDSFGPTFTERAITIGKGKWNVGFNYLQSSYDSLDGLDLEGDMTFQLLHQDAAHDDRQNPFFEGDLINVHTFLEVDTKTSVLYANYGASDKFDLAIAVPFVSVDLAATAELSIDRLSTNLQPGIHRFQNGGDTAVFADSDSASGIGDVVLRGKYRFAGGAANGFAAALDVRLPTGDEEDLLGTGFVQTKLTLLGSGTWGKMAAHGNLGYAIASGDSDVIDELPDELSYAGALDFAVHPRFTISGELVGRTLFDATSASIVQRSFSFVNSAGQAGTAQRPEVTFVEDDLALLWGGLGVKFNPAGNLLLSLEGLYSLSDDGLQDEDLVALFGIEYSF